MGERDIKDLRERYKRVMRERSGKKGREGYKR